VQFLGGEEGKPFGEIEAHLVAEDRQGAGSGAVHLRHALVEDSLQELVIGMHALSMPGDAKVWKQERFTRPQ
jgi:hypothetical protein